MRIYISLLSGMVIVYKLKYTATDCIQMKFEIWLFLGTTSKQAVSRSSDVKLWSTYKRTMYRNGLIEIKNISVLVFE